MERLTKRDKGGNVHMDCDNCEIKYRENCCSQIHCKNNLLDRLADYEDAEEKGLLIRLPCKVGDTLYFMRGCVICGENVRTFFIGHPSHRIEQRNMKMIRLETFDLPFNDLGKTVFLTEEEAEAALKEESKK